VTAFLLVYCQHALPQHSDPSGHAADLFTVVAFAGGFGVRLFFVLSAFLLTRLLLMENDSTGGISLRAFYARRTLRIWPLYFVFVGVCVLLGNRLILPGIEPGHLFGTATFTLNWFQGLDKNVALSISGILWSVAVEEQLYVIWPLLLIALLRRNRLVSGLVGFGAIAVVARIIIAVANVPYPAMWVVTMTAFDSFAIGGLLALVTQRYEFRLGARTRLALVAGGLLLPVLLTWHFDLAVYDGRHAVWAYLAVNLASAAGLAGALGNSDDRSPPPVARATRALVWGGRRTYGLYVWHRLALVLVIMALSDREATELRFFPIALALTAVFAALSYRWVEMPFLRIKSRLGKVASAPV
jgi:peptidoglycan/LPS O-acetylase OafA/YrhL